MRRNLKVLTIVAASAAALVAAGAGMAAATQGPGVPKPSVGGSGKTITVILTGPGASGGFTDPGGATLPKTGRAGGGATAGGTPGPALRSCAGATNLIPCLPAAGAAPPPPPPPEAGAVIVAASRVTLQRELPQPALVVQPGFAVTGLAAYLEIHTADDLTFTFAGFRNAVFVTCRWTSFDVDWGDGARPADVTSVGGPYPVGDVTHVYQQASAGDDLHAAENWSCPWRDEIGGAGVLLLQSDNHLPLEIREIQAVSD